ncbi:hypothetical protein [Anaerotignum sp.]|uniref:hypothetical protein n=1 Tax=Anaerotignum sp. TaxID=2039241 RepID=UPI002899C5F7|nr:hypothetical protein [Anaerotignum sp.]
MNALNYINNLFWLGVPDILKGLALTLLFIYIFKNAIKKHSAIFYIYPALLFLWYCTYGILNLLNVNLYDQIGETIWWELLWLPHSFALDTVIGLAFIMIVMFIGVLPKWKFVRQLYTIRKEMSIIGGLILIGHGVMRLPTMKWAWENLVNMNLFLFFSYAILGVILLILIFIPWITSFHFARKHFSARGWKKLQTYTSVPLMVLICVFGIAINLGWGFSSFSGFGIDLWEATTIPDGSAVSNLAQGYGVATAFLSAKIYLLLLVSYVWLRIIKTRKQPIPIKQYHVQPLESNDESLLSVK